MPKRKFRKQRGRRVKYRALRREIFRRKALKKAKKSIRKKIAVFNPFNILSWISAGLNALKGRGTKKPKSKTRYGKKMKKMKKRNKKVKKRKAKALKKLRRKKLQAKKRARRKMKRQKKRTRKQTVQKLTAAKKVKKKLLNQRKKTMKKMKKKKKSKKTRIKNLARHVANTVKQKKPGSSKSKSLFGKGQARKIDKFAKSNTAKKKKKSTKFFRKYVPAKKLRGKKRSAIKEQKKLNAYLDRKQPSMTSDKFRRIDRFSDNSNASTHRHIDDQNNRWRSSQDDQRAQQESEQLRENSKPSRRRDDRFTFYFHQDQYSRNSSVFPREKLTTDYINTGLNTRGRRIPRFNAFKHRIAQKWNKHRESSSFVHKGKLSHPLHAFYNYREKVNSKKNTCDQKNIKKPTLNVHWMSKKSESAQPELSLDNHKVHRLKWGWKSINKSKRHAQDEKKQNESIVDTCNSWGSGEEYLRSGNDILSSSEEESSFEVRRSEGDSSQDYFQTSQHYKLPPNLRESTGNFLRDSWTRDFRAKDVYFLETEDGILGRCNTTCYQRSLFGSIESSDIFHVEDAGNLNETEWDQVCVPPVSTDCTRDITLRRYSEPKERKMDTDQGVNGIKHWCKICASRMEKHNSKQCS